MKSFNFLAPLTVKEALGMLSEHGKSAVIIAGGTDIVIELNERKISPETVINISRLKELDYIRTEGGMVRIGARSTFTSISENPYIKEHVKILHDAASHVGSPQIANLGTIGGNLVTSSVAGDGLAACVTLDADVTLESVRGKRVMKLTEFLAGEGMDKRNALLADELLTEVSFPMPDARTYTAFYKLARRKSLAISVIAGGFAVKVDENDVCTWASMRGGALGRYPMQFKSAEEHLVGKKLTLETMQQTLPMMHDQVLEANKSRPWSVYYKKESVKGVFNKLFADVLGQMGVEVKA